MSMMSPQGPLGIQLYIYLDDVIPIRFGVNKCCCQRQISLVVVTMTADLMESPAKQNPAMTHSPLFKQLHVANNE